MKPLLESILSNRNKIIDKNKDIANKQVMSNKTRECIYNIIKKYINTDKLYISSMIGNRLISHGNIDEKFATISINPKKPIPLEDRSHILEDILSTITSLYKQNKKDAEYVTTHKSTYIIFNVAEDLYERSDSLLKKTFNFAVKSDIASTNSVVFAIEEDDIWGVKWSESHSITDIYFYIPISWLDDYELEKDSKWSNKYKILNCK